MTRPVVLVHAGAGSFSRDHREREASRAGATRLLAAMVQQGIALSAAAQAVLDEV